MPQHTAPITACHVEHLQELTTKLGLPYVTKLVMVFEVDEVVKIYTEQYGTEEHIDVGIQVAEDVAAHGVAHEAGG